MGDIILNLGPFNPCCEYLREDSVSEYPTDFYDCGGKVHYYSNKLEVESVDIGDVTTVPTFLLCVHVDGVSDKDRIEVIRRVELKILEMIYCLTLAIDGPVHHDKIIIPIRTIDIVEVDGRLRVIVEIGIAIFV
ncbi:hypothetical protein LCGC14_0834300 [marine sediment metagenome]|uniref:Uncharacterized protein n=1 Tax=marine sediment metagenome TaxID=412755 RepID=A0A0F9Q0B1_9ZZZZ